MNSNTGNMNENNSGISQNNGMNGTIGTQNNVPNMNSQPSLQGMSLGNLETLDSSPEMSGNVNSQASFANLNTTNNVGGMNDSQGINSVNLLNPGVEQTNSFNQGIQPSQEPVNQAMNSNISNNNTNSSVPNFFVPNSNEGGTNNIFESVPTPPSMNDFNHMPTNKKSKKMSKTTIILLVILLICIIGAGIYFVLTNVKNPTSKGTINLISDPLMWELGTELPSDVSRYATITGFDQSNCKVDTSKVDKTKKGSYEYTLTCGNLSKSGKIILDDKSAPVVTVKELTVLPGTKVQIEDFIVSCSDASNCSYGLENSSVSLEQMAMEEGSYQFNIIVSDDYNNQATVALNLVVSNNAPVKYMYCTPTESEDSEINATLQIAYNYGINNDNVLVKTEKIYTYTFDVEEDYLKVKNAYDEATGIQGTVGVTAFDDDEFIITITKALTEEDLANEFNVSSFSTNYDELKEFHLNQGISCKNR